MFAAHHQSDGFPYTLARIAMKLVGLIRQILAAGEPSPDAELEALTMLRFGVGLAIALTLLAAPAALAEAVRAAAAPGAIPPLPERKTAPASPIVMPPPAVWSAAEIDAAKARCTAALKGLNAVVTYEPPIREGDCGNPAPIRLSRLDNVTFTPAALINCGMLAPLHAWITKDLQPLAARQLGSRITGIQVMSDYSCRTAFGRVGKKLSQHAYVDALDIRGFVTSSGQSVSVLEGWGATERDMIAAAEAAKAREAKLAEAQAQPGATSAAPRVAAATTAITPGGRVMKAARADVDAVVGALLPGKKQQMASRLGGPTEKPLAPAGAAKAAGAKAEQKTAALSPDALAPAPAGPRARFLREAHAAACRIFGTTLGPEANEAHRNHFHVDMAERKIKKICD
jgi:hypothetical protein